MYVEYLRFQKRNFKISAHIIYYEMKRKVGGAVHKSPSRKYAYEKYCSACVYRPNVYCSVLCIFCVLYRSTTRWRQMCGCPAIVNLYPAQRCCCYMGFGVYHKRLAGTLYSKFIFNEFESNLNIKIEIC